MSFIPVASFLAGGMILGFVGWLLNGILDEFVAVNIHETGDIYSFITIIWTVVFVIYWVFGGLWMIRRYNEKEYGGMM